MRITENYQLGFDRYNVIVKERFEKKEGKGKDAVGTGEYDFKDVAFCKNIETACFYILQREISSSEAADVNEMIKVIQRSRDEIQRSVEVAGIDYKQLMIDSAKKEKVGVPE